MHPGFFYIVVSRLSFPLGVVSGFAGHCESVCALARNDGSVAQNKGDDGDRHRPFIRF